MSSSYIVVAINNASQIEVLELYAGIQSALDRAWNLAASRGGITGYCNILANPSPPEERLPDDSLRWTVFQSYQYFVGVFYKPIQTCVKSKKELDLLDYMMSGIPLNKVNVDREIVSDNVPVTLADPNLPGGWDYQNKPVLMKTLIENTLSVKETSKLTEHQRWALVKARIAKRPKFNVLINFYVYMQSAALQCLGNTPSEANNFGWDIVSHECVWLDQFRKDQCIKHHF